ncbi:MAG: HTTM domain-containing protein [Deltaproteobacteria bacterium]|nr:HTTM domain-containing protein [Deltaproteobacteria bacterium]
MKVLLKHMQQTWLNYWFSPPDPTAQWAVIRLGTALVLLYVLFVRSYDLVWPLSLLGEGEPGLPPLLPSPDFPLALFGWILRPWWLWGVHSVALLAAFLMMLGVFPRVMAILSLVFQFSYAHQSPALLLGLDYLLITALCYLSLAPSSAMLSLYQVPPLPPYMRISYNPHRVWDETATPSLSWGAFPARLLQLHLSVIYLNSGLGLLGGDWLAGQALWHPKLQDPAPPVALATLETGPWIISLITYALLLFELFYPVLVWVRPVRYLCLSLMLVAHLSAAILWDLVPFNLLMIILNIIYIPREHMQAVVKGIRSLIPATVAERR